MSLRAQHLALLAVVALALPACRATFSGDSDSADNGDGDGDGDGDNLLTNGGFEEVFGGVPKNWSYEGDGTMGQMAGENLEDPYAGDRTLRMYVPGDSNDVHYAETGQVIAGSYPAGTTFEGRIFARCVDLCDTLPVGIYLFVGYTEPDPEGNEYATLGLANGTVGANWTPMIGSATIDAPADYVIFSMTGSNGIFDYDEAFVAVVPEG